MAYFSEAIIRLDTNTKDTSFADLIPLTIELKNKRVIGMGEATHGTHEFSIAKIRFFKYLVKNSGFKIFALEAGFAECRKVNDFVLCGKGSAEFAIKGLYNWPWKTEELLELVNWIRKYNLNKSRKDQIKFYGFDMQYDKSTIVQITSILRNFNTKYFDNNFKDLISTKLFDFSLNAYNKMDDNEIEKVKKLIRNLRNYALTNKMELCNRYSPDTFEYLIQDINVYEQCLQVNLAVTHTSFPFKNQTKVRDASMANNINWILKHEGPDSKIFLWAHNGHISKMNNFTSSMGKHLKDFYGQQYFAIGFDFNKGSFNAVNIANPKLMKFSVGNAKNGSSGNLFSQLNMFEFFVNVEEAISNNNTARSFLNKKMPQRRIGAGFDIKNEDEYYLNEAIYKQFDGLIFVNNTTPTRLIKSN